MAANTGENRSVHAKASAFMERLRSSFAACKRALFGLTTPEEAIADIKQAERDCERVISALDSIAQSAVNVFQSLAQQKFDRGLDYREFRFDQQLPYEADLPDWLKTLCIILAAFIGEGTLAGFMMALEGHMGIVAGLAYGYTFSAINIILGVACGFLCVRYMGYRSGSQTPSPRDPWVRWTARIGFVFFITLITLLVFSATRTRAMGGHIGIFNFQELGFFAAFNDGIAIAIGALGVLGSIISIYEGTRGFSDMVPGYTEMRKKAHQYIDEEAFLTKESYLDDADDEFENGEADYLEIWEQAKESIYQEKQARLGLLEQWLAHNNEVEKLKADTRVFALNRTRVEGKRVQANLKEFDAYLLPLDELNTTAGPVQSGHSQSDVLNRLAQAHRRAIAAINSAYNEYLSFTPQFDEDTETGE